MRSGKWVAVIAIGMVTFFGCATQTPSELSSNVVTVSEPIQQLNQTIHRRSSSNLLVLKDGSSVYVWVSNVLNEEEGQGFKSFGELKILDPDGITHTVSDAESVALVDAETPPQIALGPDGSLLVAYSASNTPESIWTSTSIRTIHSNDGGKSWSDPVSVGGPFGGYQNNHELHIGRDGTAYVVWLDSRLAKEDGRDINILVSTSTDGGKSWSNPVVVDTEPSCECCRAAITTDPEGNVYIAWRKKLEGGIRDIAVSRSGDQGATWSTPVVAFHDNWVQGYCPDAGPSIVADNNGVLHLGWWTGSESGNGVKYTRSWDQGASFSAPLVLSSSEVARPSHVQLALNKNDVAVVWDDGSLETPQIVLSVSSDKGKTFTLPAMVSNGLFAAAYPHVAFVENQLEIVWNERGTSAMPSGLAMAELGNWIPAGEATGPRILSRRIVLD